MNSRQHKICSNCERVPYATLCQSCRRRFCQSCFNLHADAFSRRCRVLSSRCQDLYDSLTNPSAVHESSLEFWLNDVNGWRDLMHSKIDEIANAAIDEGHNIFRMEGQNLCSNVLELESALKRISGDQSSCQKSLDQLEHQLAEIEEDCKKISKDIRIDSSACDQVNFSSLLRIFNAKRELMHNLPPNSRRAARKNLSQYSMKPADDTEPAWGSTARNSSRHGPRARSTSHSRTYQCISCKTLNHFAGDSDLICSNCRMPLDS